MATGTAWRQWVETRDTYSPQLEHGRSISQALKSFDENLLAQRTAIWSVRATRSTRTIHPGQVDDARLSQLLESRAQERPLYDMFFINRFLVQNPREPVPSDAHRLLISKDAFQLLMSCCSVPPSFLFALSRYYYPNGRGFQRRHEESNNTNNNRSSSSVSSQWYFLPFRVQVPCTDMRDSHENTRTGRNQMNPFHYLHLPNQEVDIRGSQIAVYVEYNKHTDVTTAICVNFMDGRWRVLVEEPQTRILEALMHSSAHLGPMWIHLILFTTVTRWWNNSLHSVNEQLIAYELELQDKSEDASPPNIFYGNISKALHAMAAHVHRYGTEMDSIQSTTSEMAGLCLEALNGNDGVAVANFAQLSSQITATKSFVSELEKKIQNLLALLFNRMQITNDRRMVAILEAAQDEAAYSRQIAERSQQLSEDMKKDSVSMKTIAIMTMFFLPATSFAAILAMPFFATNKYLSDGRTVWIWIVLTLPTTAMAYAVYYLRNKRELEKAQEKKGRLRAV